jgi:predicted metal-dependent RNase
MIDGDASLSHYSSCGSLPFAVRWGYDSPLMVPDGSKDEQRIFARHYSQMSDSELLNIALQPWPLSDAAWEGS